MTIQEIKTTWAGGEERRSKEEKSPQERWMAREGRKRTEVLRGGGLGVAIVGMVETEKIGMMTDVKTLRLGGVQIEIVRRGIQVRVNNEWEAQAVEEELGVGMKMEGEEKEGEMRISLGVAETKKR